MMGHILTRRHAECDLYRV